MYNRQYIYTERERERERERFIYIYIPVNPLPGVETNDDWVVWLTVVLVKLISETQFCCVSHSWLAFI